MGRLAQPTTYVWDGRAVVSQTLVHPEQKGAVEVCHALRTHPSERCQYVTDSPRPYPREVQLNHSPGSYHFFRHRLPLVKQVFHLSKSEVHISKASTFTLKFKYLQVSI